MLRDRDEGRTSSSVDSSVSLSAARSTRALLFDPTFGPWFWGNLVSNAGNWLFNVVAAIVVFRLSGSAFLVGVVSALQFLPLVVLSPWAGALSDRFDRRWLLLAGQALAAASATALAVSALLVGIEGLPGAWPLLASALGIGLGQALTKPAQNSLVPLLVDDVDLESSVSLTALTFGVGRALGPAVAGLLLVTWGPSVAFLMNAVSYSALIGALLIIKPRAHVRPEGDKRSALAGLQHVRKDRRIVLLLFGVATAGFTADPVITLSPPLTEMLGGGDALVAAMVSSFGVAAVVVSLLAGRLQRRLGGLTAAAYGGLVTAGGLLLVALAASPWMALVGFAGTGAGSVLAATSFTTVLQRHVVESFRGRVMALWAVAFLGNRPIAALIDGAAADMIGPRYAMSAAFLVALAGVWLARKSARAEEMTLERAMA